MSDNENKNRQLLGFEGYGATVTGKIFNANTKTEVPIETAEGKNYPVVTINDRQYSARRLVYEAFNGPIEGNQRVTLKKGVADKTTCAIQDLELFTPPREVKIEDFYDVFEQMAKYLNRISNTLYDIKQRLEK